ncbi:MAG: arylamine N-acetyltransferase [Lachnospiraceae bacterium]|nr:arylamine N-acetyltransferase [Lachnospiraceae bacterium]
MFDFTFDGYSKEECEAYLKRMDASFDGQVTLDNLNQLIFKHQCTVPFEDLAPYEGWGKVDLKPEALFEKIVVNRRGGFCFELNSAFMLLLKGLGFDAYGIICRNAVPSDVRPRGLYHMAIMVRLDNQDFFCDVGLGGLKPACALPTTGEKQTANGVCYWVEEGSRGWKMARNDVNNFYVLFVPAAMVPKDFTAYCTELLSIETGIFRTKRLLSIITQNGMVQISGNTLTITKDRIETKREYDEAELPELLKKYFGIEYK